MAEAYPLEWPEGWKRTEYPIRSQFSTTQNIAQLALIDEVRKLGGSYTIVSTDIPLRNDGMPYAGRKPPEDKGVACYFLLDDRQRVFACDQYDRIGDNMQAIRKTIEAVRGIKRWGASDLLERTMSAFDALPPPESYTARHWTEVLGLKAWATANEINEAYRKKAKSAHSDVGGSDQAMAELNVARDQALVLAL